VEVAISHNDHIKLINEAGRRGWRYIRLASELLENAIMANRSINLAEISQCNVSHSDESMVHIPISQQAKIALINQVGSRSIAYTTLAQKLLSDAVRSRLELK